MGYKEADMEESIAGRDRVRSGVNFWTVPFGDKGRFASSRIRILPPREDHPNKMFYHWAAVHGNLPGSDRPVLCPHRMFDETCPACMEANSLSSQGFKDDARELYPSWRALVNIVVLDKDGEVPDDAEPQVWAMPKTLMEDLLSKVEELPKSERNITSPTTGRDVIIRRKGKSSKDTRYECELDDPAPFDEPDIFDAMEFLPDVYPKVQSTRITALLTAGPPELADPFDDGVDEVVDADYQEVVPTEEPEPAPRRSRRTETTRTPETAPPSRTRTRTTTRRAAPEPEPDEGDDGDDEDGDPEPDAQGQTRVAAARDRLQRALRG